MGGCRAGGAQCGLITDCGVGDRGAGKVGGYGAAFPVGLPLPRCVLRPDGLARPVPARVPVPARGQLRHQEQAPARLLRALGVRGGGAHRQAFGAGVGDLDAHAPAAGRCVQAEVEVPAGYVPVPYGVRGELGGDQHDLLVRGGAVRDPPGVEADGDQPPGEAGPSGCGGEAHPEDAVAGAGEASGTGVVNGAAGLARHAHHGPRGGAARPVVTRLAGRLYARYAREYEACGVTAFRVGALAR
ncbi:hypothetical protein GCM10023079_52700 [Streptomyces chitinivorans]